MSKPDSKPQPDARQEFATVALLTPVRLGARLLDGTVSPFTVREHEGIHLYDAGRFLEISWRAPEGAIGAGTLYRRWVPWVHVSYAVPMGAE